MAGSQYQASGLTLPAGMHVHPTEFVHRSFSICKPSHARETIVSAAAGAGHYHEQWKQHGMKVICVTARAAGGTAKTTTAFHLAYGLVKEGFNVLAVNLDGQLSLEERALGKVVNKFYGCSIDK